MTETTKYEAELLCYFREMGMRKPGDLEDDFCGTPDVLSMIVSPLSAWRSSPYFYALSTLVEAGKVKYWRDERGDVCYALNSMELQ